MKTTFLFLLTGILTLTVQPAHGQKELYGKWTASCPFEKIDAASMQFCSICPQEQNSTSSLIVKDFDIAFDKSEVKIGNEANFISTSYKWNNDLNAIEFQYKGTTYKFKVLTGADEKHIVLKDTDGLLVVLAKK